MRRHYFLGAAAGFSKRDRIDMRKSEGQPEDVEELEQYLLAEYDGKQAVLFENGRSAIAATLKAYRESMWPEGGEVIINGFTCHAVVQGVKAAGLTPIYADIDPETLNFTTEMLEKVLTSGTRAIIVQNTLGNMVDVSGIEKFCKKHKLVLIEDLAHCVGRFYADGREAGKVGGAAVFSFGKEKSIDVCGGGAAVIRDAKVPALARPKGKVSDKKELRARIYPTIGYIYRGLSYLRLHGVFMRLMFKLDLVRKSADGEVDFERTLCDFQAKMALKMLKSKYKLKKRPLRTFALVENRGRVLEQLEREGYYFGGFWYERPVSPERYYKEAHFPEKDCPNAVFVSQHIVNLPNYYAGTELARAQKIIKEHEIKESELG